MALIYKMKNLLRPKCLVAYLLFSVQTVSGSEDNFYKCKYKTNKYLSSERCEKKSGQVFLKLCTNKVCKAKANEVEDAPDFFCPDKSSGTPAVACLESPLGRNFSEFPIPTWTSNITNSKNFKPFSLSKNRLLVKIDSSESINLFFLENKIGDNIYSFKVNNSDNVFHCIDDKAGLIKLISKVKVEPQNCSELPKGE